VLRISCDLKYYKYILEETRRPSSTNPKRKSNSTIPEGWGREKQSKLEELALLLRSLGTLWKYIY